MSNSFRLEDVFKIAGVGIVLCGAVTEGQIQTGSIVTIEGKDFSVVKIETNNLAKELVVSGENAGIFLTGEKVDKDFFSQQIGQTLMFN